MDLLLTGHHIDHKKPFSKGGLPVEVNLQALWPECNLRKGCQVTS
ncbi:HNH endonuclease [Puniceicoccales bacterium CK1056]|uniref:HNH endonuclease n=1 Tax=Oceanipulchritudo coccoides TaxID=2706888 RepID=A0A6B2LYB6_9BACT|nr:HNH endonuclease [Oceanipulchritudo coccoides]